MQHVEGFLLDLPEQIVKLDQPLTVASHLRTATAFAAGRTFHHRLFRQLVHFVNRVPGTFVADARQFGALADGAGVPDLFQQRDAAWVSEQFLLQL
ncbi:hypothetical protein D3C77_739040 [compost metagenome]